MNLQQFFASRSIRQPTLDAFGVRCDDDKIAFPYLRNGQEVACKFRGRGKKMWSTEGGESRLYNLDACIGAERVVIVEGEMDALAVHEAGIPHVVSVPNGAPGKPGGLSRYGYIIDAWKEGLRKDAEIVLAVDADEPGQNLAKDLSAVFGPVNCSVVHWPEGIKDANDMLIKDGAEALADLLTNGAVPWMRGVYEFSEIPDSPPIQAWELGWPEMEGRIRIAPGFLSIVTGFPGHGKSTWAIQAWLQMARAYDFPVAIFSGETRAKPFLQRTLRQMIAGKRERDMSEGEKRNADAVIEKHFKFIIPDDGQMSFADALNYAELAILRKGCRAIVLDPWNMIEHTRPKDQMETEYIRDCLNQALAVAQRYNVHFQIIAHPKSSEPEQRKRPPHGHDISGGQYWWSKADQLLVMFRQKFWDEEQGKRITDCKLYQHKSKYEEMGFECSVDFNFDLDRSQYVCTEYETRLEKGLRDGS